MAQKQQLIQAHAMKLASGANMGIDDLARLMQANKLAEEDILTMDVEAVRGLLAQRAAAPAPAQQVSPPPPPPPLQVSKQQPAILPQQQQANALAAFRDNLRKFANDDVAVNMRVRCVRCHVNSCAPSEDLCGKCKRTALLRAVKNEKQQTQALLASAQYAQQFNSAVQAEQQARLAAEQRLLAVVVAPEPAQPKGNNP